VGTMVWVTQAPLHDSSCSQVLATQCGSRQISRSCLRSVDAKTGQRIGSAVSLGPG
jgi:hypothetical protein